MFQVSKTLQQLPGLATLQPAPESQEIQVSVNMDLAPLQPASQLEKLEKPPRSRLLPSLPVRLLIMWETCCGTSKQQQRMFVVQHLGHHTLVMGKICHSKNLDNGNIHIQCRRKVVFCNYLRMNLFYNNLKFFFVNVSSPPLCFFSQK